MHNTSPTQNGGKGSWKRRPGTLQAHKKGSISTANKPCWKERGVSHSIVRDQYHWSSQTISLLTESIKQSNNLTLQIHQAPLVQFFTGFTRSPCGVYVLESEPCDAQYWPLLGGTTLQINKLLKIKISIIGDDVRAHGINGGPFLSPAASTLMGRFLIRWNRWLDRKRACGRGGGVGDGGGGDNQSALWSGAVF